MIIKKYVADTMSEALSMIKFDLGPEAVIISKRAVKQKGLMGLLAPKKLEVTAAVDENRKVETDHSEKVEEIKEAAQKKEIEEELNQVKEMLQKLVEEKKVKKEKKPGVKKMLLDRDVSEDVLNAIIAGVKEKDEYSSAPKVPDSVLTGEIEEIIKVDPSKEGRIHAFIGPTGVGKTTTIAKLAAMQSLNSGKKVGLITIDTYRIGAVEQLKIYAEILGLPFEVINSVNDIEKTLAKMSGCDNIFVDTTGRSIKNIMQLSELKLYLDRIKPDRTYLVVSMTTKYKDLLQILSGFSTMEYNSIVLTKFDETTTYGPVVNIAYNTGVPISYITTGQNVPDDIEGATKARLLELVMGEGNI